MMLIEFMVVASIFAEIKFAGGSSICHEQKQEDEEVCWPAVRKNKMRKCIGGEHKQEVG
jgi:hypothetical protein